MNWNVDTDFNVTLTDSAKVQVQDILDYICFKLENPQASYNVEQDMKKNCHETFAYGRQP